MELIKQKIWMVMRYELNDEDVEVCKAIHAYTTREEAINKQKRYMKEDDGLKYAVRSTYTWFPKMQ